MNRTTMKWLEESRLPHMADVAKTVGLDMTGWSIGHHFGPCITLVDKNMVRYGTWSTLAAAERGTDDMIRAWQAIADARKGD